MLDQRRRQWGDIVSPIGPKCNYKIFQVHATEMHILKIKMHLPVLGLSALQ